MNEVIQDEWRAASSKLASWAMERLVNRKDVWGQYTEMSERDKLNAGKRTYKALTLPQKAMRGKDMVTLDKLTRHFKSRRNGHLIGLHAVSIERTSKWLAIDIDLHDCHVTDVEDLQARNFSAAKAWWEKLQMCGYDPLLLDSNGLGGYHILTLFSEPAPTVDVYAFGQSLISDWEGRNLDEVPETFPKSGEFEKDKLGSWLRVFGRHHTHPHFTRVWSGEPWLDCPWLEGMNAIEVILGAQPGPPPPVADPDAEPAPKGTNSGSRGDFKSTKRPVICVDFDGVLAQFDGWKGAEVLGDPVDGAREFMDALAEFADITIFSSRPEESEEAMRKWFRKHEIAYHSIARGDQKPLAKAYIDDRAISCRPQELGPTVFIAVEHEVRRLCGEVTEESAAKHAGLAEIIGCWETFSEADRKAVLKTVRERQALG